MTRIFKAVLALLIARLPPAVAQQWFGNGLRTYDGRVIEPKAQALGELTLSLRDPGAEISVDTLRKGYRDGRAMLDSAGIKPVLHEDRRIPGPDGDIKLRLYDARDPAVVPAVPRPTLLFLHGGGWVIGDLDTHDAACARLAASSGARVVAVDYRLAPEHPFPAAPDDVLAVHDWLQDNGPSLGVDPARLAVGGDSAGGNLTAVLMHDLAAAGRPLPKAQLLIYPATDIRMEGQIFDDLTDAYILPPALCNWFRDTYLPAGTDPTDPRVSPAFSDHLAGQPPAFIVTAGHDVLRPQGEAYAEKLRAAGVEVAYEEMRGQIHGFINFNAVTPSSRAALDRMGTWLKDKLGS